MLCLLRSWRNAAQAGGCGLSAIRCAEKVGDRAAADRMNRPTADVSLRRTVGLAVSRS